GPQGFEARGGFRLVALGRSEGKFTLKQTKSGRSTDWRAEIDVPSVTVDDFMALVPKSTEPAATEAVQPKPDRAPFWAGHTGGAEIKVGSVTAMGVRAESIEATLAADGASLLLSRLVGKLSGGSFNGKGALGFRPLTSGGPYVLGADLSAQQLDLGALLAGFPSTKDMLEGKGDAKLRVTATAGTAGELAGRAVIEAEAVSKGGRLRAFGDGTGKAAGITQGAGEIADVLGAVAILGGALGGNEKLLKGGAALSAAAKLQRSVSDFRYDLVEVRAERLASGTLKLTKLEARNEELTLTASGGISMNPALALADRPLAIDAQLRGRGEFADYFQILGFAEAAPSPDGLTLGPGVKVTGSLNDIRNDLTERIQAAVSRNRSAPAQPQRAPQAAPGGEAAPGRRPNPLGDLLKELGR
ncbi:MAG: AsmA family protein, partial [Verrucomicrobiota bacterium]